MGTRARWASGLALAAIIALSGWARAEDTQVPEQARTHFRVGVSYLNDPAGPRYEDALREFVAAHKAAPNSWKTLNNIGLCALNLERDQEAIDAYQQALELAGDEGDAKWRQDVERDIATLKAGLVRVTIKVEPPGATLVDERLPTSGKPILNRYENPTGSFELGIHAGRHRLSAISGSKSAVWEFDAQAGAVLSHDFSLEAPTPSATPPSAIPPPAPSAEARPVTLERRTPPGVYVALAATGLFAIGAGVTGYLTVDKHDEFNDQNGVDRDRASDLRKSGKQLTLVTDVLVGAAVLGGATTAYLYFTRPTASHEKAAARLTIAPSVGRESGWVTVTGRF